MLRSGIAGWVISEHAVVEPESQSCGNELQRLALNGFGSICTLSYAPSPYASIPPASDYGAYARRCADFVRDSRSCSIWVIGDEPNVAQFRPGCDTVESTRGIRAFWRDRAPTKKAPVETIWEPLTSAGRVFDIDRHAYVVYPQEYAEYYRLCRETIMSIRGHEADQVLIAAMAPWNTDTRYTGNERGDWVTYFRDVLDILGPDGCDGLAVHSYTHGPDPRLITSAAMMNEPYHDRHVEFRAYRDFLDVVPEAMKRLPVYLTQVHQGGEWNDSNTGWVQNLYDEIDSWN